MPNTAALPAVADEALGLLDGRAVVALTGAGLSTDSGIPDYRGPDAPPRRPMTYAEFTSGPVAQRRYWARSHLGWSRIRRAAPNPGHRALAELERHGRLRGLITQNVDGLHERAGSHAVIDLHGRISDVICLGCKRITSRRALHERLVAANPGFAESVGQELEIAPDGDVLLEETEGFRLVGCVACGGVLKPDVVFFGENVPKPRVAEAFAMVDALAAGPAPGALLVAGSSLSVMSGLRFVRHAHALGLPVVIVNRGATRGDGLAALRVHAGCSEFLGALAERAGQAADQLAGSVIE